MVAGGSFTQRSSPSLQDSIRPPPSDQVRATCTRSRPPSCAKTRLKATRPAVVELEHAAESLTALQRTCPDPLCLGSHELVAEALVRPFLMVMVHELPNGSPEVCLAERDD